MTSAVDDVARDAGPFLSDEARRLAVLERNPQADGAFVYSVKTTGVYCRPTCPSRPALWKNVDFHATCRDAESAGFRPCKRCRPSEASLGERHADVVAQVCRLIEESPESPSLDELAEAVGVSRHHLHRIFKTHTGLTPKQYAVAHRIARVRRDLAEGRSVTQAIYQAGFQSSSRFYETSNEALGMTPKVFRAGGEGTSIRFAVGESRLGSVLVAASEKGVCAIFLGDDPDELVKALQDQFPRASLIGGDDEFEGFVARVLGFLETPAMGLDLPLDIRGTAFQQRVWEALRRIPPGQTATYTEIAERIGSPKSVRAVANACGANVLAVAIPCHRVVRTDGSPSGYRWGIERKTELLRRESAELP